MEKEIESRLNEILEEGKLKSSDRHLAPCSWGEGMRIDFNDKESYWLNRSENSKLYDGLMDVYSERLSHTVCPKHHKEAMGEDN